MNENSNQQKHDLFAYVFAEVHIPLTKIIFLNALINYQRNCLTSAHLTIAPFHTSQTHVSGTIDKAP